MSIALLNLKRSLLFLGLLISLSNPADGVVTVDDVNSLSQRATQVSDKFYTDSFKLRMKYEFNEQLLTDAGKKQLLDSSKQASDQLAQTIEKQKNFKKQIEDYDGDDWDQKYGLSGIWRKLAQDIYISTLSKCQIDLYIAAVSTKDQKLLLQNIITQIDSTSQRQNSTYLQLLKAKVSVMLGKESPDRLYTLTEQLFASNSEQDIELVLSLAFLQRRYAPASFEKTLQQWPRIEDFLASLILEELFYDFEQNSKLEQTTVLDAELAAMAAWKQQASNYKNLLSFLSDQEKFQKPLILYVTAAALAESSPNDSIDLLIRASRLQQQQKSDRLNLTPEKIAKQAAQLASSYYSKDQLNWIAASAAFENYYAIGGKNADEYLGQLLYLAFKNPTAENKKLAEKIAGKSNGQWRNAARLELIKIAIEDPQHKNKEKLLKKLNALSKKFSEANQTYDPLRIESIALYCHLLLESPDKASAQKVLDTLAETGTIDNINMQISRSRALSLLGQMDESVVCMLLAVEPNYCEYLSWASELLWAIFDKVEMTELAAADFTQMMRNCKKLAQVCYNCSHGRERFEFGLFLAQSGLFLVTDADRLSAIGKLLDEITKDDSQSVDLLRCRAGLLTAQGKHKEAADSWTRVCEIRNKRSWKWWRAKFYELDSFSKSSPGQRDTALHAIEVLEATFADIPPLWAEKLGQLGEQ